MDSELRKKKSAPLYNTDNIARLLFIFVGAAVCVCNKGDEEEEEEVFF